ncbi:hypothetical protein ACLOJK_027399 [Asimina triloba]
MLRETLTRKQSQSEREGAEMGLLKRIVGILGFLKGDNHDHSDDDARRHADGESSSDRADKEEAQCRRTGKGFSVQVPIALDRAAAAAAAAHGPVLVQCNLGDGGVQPVSKKAEIHEYLSIPHGDPTRAGCTPSWCYKIWGTSDMYLSYCPTPLTSSRSLLSDKNPVNWPTSCGAPHNELSKIILLGLQWYAKRLKIDEDGDVADEFLDEVLPEALRVEDQRQHTAGKSEEPDNGCQWEYPTKCGIPRQIAMDLNCTKADLYGAIISSVEFLPSSHLHIVSGMKRKTVFLNVDSSLVL